MKIIILVVDDSTSILVYVEALLNSISEDYIILKENNGESALQTIMKEAVDLIILDIQMPIMDGLEVAKELKSNKVTSEIPIVFLTDSTKLRTEGLKIGAIDCLTKPVEPEQFISKILLYTRLVKSIKENIRKEQIIQAQSRLAQMGEMIAMIAHQWRQPLGTISSCIIDLQMKQELGFFDLSTKDGQKKSREFFAESFEDISCCVQNLSETIDDFRNFYKPNKERTLVKLEDVIKKSLSIIGTSLRFHNINIVEEYNCKKEILVHFSELMQVLLNILNNAQESLNNKIQQSNEPYIEIITTSTTISIFNNGGNIPKDIVSNIFEPYFSTKGKNGTGLGLYMSKIIINEHHSGKLTVINKNDGVCFMIEL